MHSTIGILGLDGDLLLSYRSVNFCILETIIIEINIRPIEMLNVFHYAKHLMYKVMINLLSKIMYIYVCLES